MNQPDFIICAPLNMVNMSHGARTLVELARAIDKAGRRAFLCAFTYAYDREIVFRVNFETYVPQNNEEKQFVDAIRQVTRDFGVRLLTDFSPQYLAECYAIYPETIASRNALNAGHVIRYFLNKNGALTGRPVDLGPDDFVLGFHAFEHPEPHHVCSYTGQDLDTFHSENTLSAEHRRLDLTYIGKGATFGVTDVVPGTAEITRTWPASKDQLAALLRNCRFFYTADAYSKINTEALSCGAIPVYLNNGPWTDDDIDGSGFGVVPRIYPDATIGPDFFETFEARRAEFMDRVKTCAEGWEASVHQMIAKVDRHFGARASGR